MGSFCRMVVQDRLRCVLITTICAMIILATIVIVLASCFKVNPNYWSHRLQFNIKEYTTTLSVFISLGVIFIVFGFLMCCAAISVARCIVIGFLIFTVSLVVIEVIGMAIAGYIISDKDFRDKIP